MGEAYQVDEHVSVKRLPHLWLDDTEIRTDVSENSGAVVRSDAVSSGPRLVVAIEKRSYDQSNSPMKTTSGCERIAGYELL